MIKTLGLIYWIREREKKTHERFSIYKQPNQEGIIQYFVYKTSKNFETYVEWHTSHLIRYVVGYIDTEGVQGRGVQIEAILPHILNESQANIIRKDQTTPITCIYHLYLQWIPI